MEPPSKSLKVVAFMVPLSMPSEKVSVGLAEGATAVAFEPGTVLATLGDLVSGGGDVISSSHSAARQSAPAQSPKPSRRDCISE